MLSCAVLFRKAFARLLAAPLFTTFAVLSLAAGVAVTTAVYSVVDKLFSFGGFRGEEDDSPIKLARRFRELAGFSNTEIDEIVEISAEARAEMQGAAS